MNVSARKQILAVGHFFWATAYQMVRGAAQGEPESDEILCECLELRSLMDCRQNFVQSLPAITFFPSVALSPSNQEGQMDNMLHHSYQGYRSESQLCPCCCRVLPVSNGWVARGRTTKGAANTPGAGQFLRPVLLKAPHMLAKKINSQNTTTNNKNKYRNK